MMARMPELSSRLTSPTVKPSRLSISSCDRTRSPPFLLPKSRLPSSTMAAHCSAMLSESSLAAASSAAAAGSSESSDASHWAAIASWSIWSVAGHDARSVPSLNDDFLEQHGADLLRRHRDVDAPGQFFLEAEQAGRAVEIGRAAVRADRSGTVSVTRGRFGLIASTCFSSLTSSTTLTLRYCTRSPGAPTRLTSMSGTSTKARRLRRRRFGVLLLAVAAHQEEPAARRRRGWRRSPPPR